MHASSHLISMREQWTTESDLVAKKRDQRLNLEWVMKRKLINPRMIEVNGTEHLACGSVAWDTAVQAELTRNSSIRITAEGTVGLLRRLFLRAYTQEVWGTCKTMSYRELADWLTTQGYITTLTEVKNASRGKLVEGVVPITPKVQALLAVLKEVQPYLEVGRFFTKLFD